MWYALWPGFYVQYVVTKVNSKPQGIVIKIEIDKTCIIDWLIDWWLINQRKQLKWLFDRKI